MSISNSSCSAGSITLSVSIASEHFEDSVSLHNNLVDQVAYDHHTCTLAALHSDFVLTLSRLELLPSSMMINFRLLYNMQMPVGVRLTQQRSFGNWVVLFQDRSVLSPKGVVACTELTCVDTGSGEVRRRFIRENELTQVSMLSGYVFVQKSKQKGLELFGVISHKCIS